MTAPTDMAPFWNDLARGPADGLAAWVRAADGRRLRVAAFGRDQRKGTVFLFPGRTEYVEKYGLTAADLAARGYAMVTVDWRGQGLAARVLADPLPGHVEDFAEFQLDVAALIGFARAQGLAEPFYLMAHSMGGCIGLRTLMGPHPFRAAAFSAPMWGIQMPAWQKPLALPGARLACLLGQRFRYAPGTGPGTYVIDGAFQDNTLTTDRAMWDYMGDHLRARPDLALGGPTMVWLKAALAECAALARMPAPDLACFTGLGSNERIVDPAPIRARMARWPKGRLQVFAGAEHEILMDRDRGVFLDQALALFEAA